jgi:hypothetical protein
LKFGFKCSPVLWAEAVRHGDLLFNHLIRPEQQRWWNRKTEGLGRLQVDDQFEFGRLLNWQISRLRTLEDAVDI